MNEEAIQNAMRKTLREMPPTNGRVGFTPTTWAALISMVIAGLTVVGILANQIYMTRTDWHEVHSNMLKDAQLVHSRMLEKINAINTNVRIHHGDLATWPEGR